MRKEQPNTEEKIRGVIMQKDDLSSEYAKERNSQKSIVVYTGETPHRIFVPYGFYYHRNDFSTYHTHSSYHEVIILVGDCEFVAGDEVLKLEGTNVLTMPPKIFHKMLTTENVLACTFFIDTAFDFSVKKLPEDIDYSEIVGLRLESAEKLNKIRPMNIGQASRISGVSPADVSVLLIYLSGGKNHTVS